MTQRELALWGKYSIKKYPRKGKCNGKFFVSRNYHRVSLTPLYSVLDGGIPGDSCGEVCLDCGKFFGRAGRFIIKDQPNKIGLFQGGQNK